MSKKTIEVKSNFDIIMPNNFSQTHSYSCPVCGFLLKRSEDFLSYTEFTCCRECALVWAYPNKTEWKKGWRPDKTQVSLEILKRREAPVSF